MSGYDLFMIVVLAAAVAWGAWKGLAWQIASIASLGVSYVVSLNFRNQLAQHITATPPWNVFLAMLILFLGTSLVVWVCFNFVSELIERVKLKEFDRQVGALFGLAKGIILCVLVTLFAVTLMNEPQRQAICNSRSGYYIALLLDRADVIMPRELHQVLDPYIREFDERIEQPKSFQAEQPKFPNPFGGGSSGSQATSENGSFPGQNLLPGLGNWGTQTEQPTTSVPSVSIGSGRGRIDAQPYRGSTRQADPFGPSY